MCWLVVKPANKQIPLEYVDTAQELNSDGYGLAWFDSNTELQVFKTLDYDEFKAKLAALTPYDAVVHLRAASVGSVTLDNVHPFPIPTGVMFHNGTISSLRPVKNYASGKWDYTLNKWVDSPDSNCSDESDTLALANLISKCTYSHLSDIMPLIQHTVTTTSNKLVFAETDGQITIVNKSLGNEEDGIWYSNTYHVPVPKKTYPAYQSTTPTYGYTKPTYTKPEVMFVYGTLKKGYGNNRFMSSAKFLGKATSINRWQLIGEDAPFPYLLGIAPANKPGHYIVGEVYEVPPHAIPAIDALEGVPTHYRKASITVVLNGKTTVASTYVKAHITYHDEQSKLITEWKPAPKSFSTTQLYKSEKEFLKRVADYEPLDEQELQLLNTSELMEVHSDHYYTLYGFKPTTRIVQREALITSIIYLQDRIESEEQFLESYSEEALDAILI